MDRGATAERFLSPRLEVRAGDDGCLFLSTPERLEAYPSTLCHYLYQWAQQAPDRTFLAQRDQAGRWRQLTFGNALADAERIGTALLERRLDSDRPLMLLSGNSINLARMMLGAMLAGVPFAPVSPAYSLASRDFSKLRYLYELLQPGMIFVEETGTFGTALAALQLSGTEVVAGQDNGNGGQATAVDELLQTPSGPGVDQSVARIGPDSVLKILFTSGSTGMPKGVINTHRMMCSNQQAIRQLWPLLAERPPVIVDWLPWNHTFGGCHNFNMMLCNGGTIYIDEGKPLPGMIEKTIANLQSVSPTLYFNVPAGFSALLGYLEHDAELCRRFFAELDLLMYAAASLPQPVRERLEQLSVATTGHSIPLVSGWGTTETAPLATSTYGPGEAASGIGLPIPGTELKLVPYEGKYDLRVRGPNITPGYWKQPEQTSEAFDEDGFYRSGDAVVLAEAGKPIKGIVFSGRMTEEFKLDTGSWVAVGNLRVAVIEACAPLLQDVVVCGQDRSEIGLLAIPDRQACLAVCGEYKDDVKGNLFSEPKVRQILGEMLRHYNASHPASSMRIGRLLFLTEPLSIDAGEITDKGYINQRGVLKNHAAMVDRLYSDDPEVIVP